MSVQHMSWAFKQELESGPKFVLVAIANFADGSGLCFPGQERLARMTGFSVRSIRNHVLALEEAGLIQRSGRRRDDGMKTSDEYQLLMSPAESAAKSPAKPAGKKRKSPAESAATHRQNFPTSPAKPAGRNRVRPEKEAPSPTQNNAKSPAESAGSTIRLTTSNNHQSKEPPTPLPKPKTKNTRQRKQSEHEFNPAQAAQDLPPNFDRELFQDFCARRLEIGKPMTLLALKQFVTRHKDHEAPVLDEMFRRAIVAGWQDLYALKPDELAALSGTAELSKPTGSRADARAAQSATDLLTAIRSRRDA